MTKLDYLEEKLKKVKELREEEEAITEVENKIKIEEEKIKEHRRSRSKIGKIMKIFQKEDKY